MTHNHPTPRFVVVDRYSQRVAGRFADVNEAIAMCRDANICGDLIVADRRLATPDGGCLFVADAEGMFPALLR